MTDTIIIFGAAVRPDGSPSGAMRDRVAAAVRLGTRLDRPRFVPTGGVGRYGQAEAEVMAALLQGHGIPTSRILIEPTGMNTLGSVRACARPLRGRAGRVYAASSAYHLPRCVLLLRMAGLRAYACPPLRGPASSSRLKRWYWRLREIPAIPVDAMVMMGLRLRRRV